MPESTRGAKRLSSSGIVASVLFSFSHKSNGCFWLALRDSGEGEDRGLDPASSFRSRWAPGTTSFQTIRRPIQRKRF
jgi:hypothetical protein